MFGLENIGETLILMSPHFDKTMAILISHCLRLSALKIFTEYCFGDKNKQSNIFRTKNGIFWSN